MRGPRSRAGFMHPDEMGPSTTARRKTTSPMATARMAVSCPGWLTARLSSTADTTVARTAAPSASDRKAVPVLKNDSGHVRTPATAVERLPLRSAPADGKVQKKMEPVATASADERASPAAASNAAMGRW